MSRLQRNMNIKQYNIPGLKLLEGARYESRIYVYDNFAYNISKTRPQTLYLHCRRATCAGYAVINLLKNMKGTFDCTKPHTHVEDTEFIKNMEFRLKLKYECQRNTTNSLKEIFDSVAEKMGGIPDGISYRSIFFSMSRARRKGKQMLESGQLLMNDDEDEENLDEGDHNYSCDESNRGEENAEDGSVLVEMPECVVDLPVKSEQVIEEEDNTESVHIHNQYDNTENNESENEYNVEMVVEEVSPIKTNSHHSKKFDLEDCNIIGCEVVSGLLTTGGYQVIMYDDFIYAVTKQTEDIIDLRCYKDSCSGSAVIFLNDKLEGIVKMKAAHNHRAPTEIVEGLKENKSPKRKALSETPTSSKRTKMSHSVKVESPVVKSENNSRKNRLVGYNFPVEKENDGHDDDDDELDDNLSYSDNMDDSDYQQSANEENSSQDSDDNIPDINANFLKSCRLPGMKVQMGLRTKTLVLTYKGFNYSMTRRRGNNFYFKCMLSSCGVIGTLKIDEKLGSFHLGSREHNHSEDTDFLKKSPSQLISRNKSEKYVATPRTSSKVRSQLATPKISKGKMVKSRKLKGSLTESWEESNQEENNDEDIETIDSESVFSSKNALALRKCNLPGVTILEGLRASSFILCYENYSYRVKNRRNNSYYLECRIPKCGATAVLNVKDKEGVLRTRENHSHPEDTDYIKTIKFRAELRNECRKNPGIPARHVFEKVLARYSGEADFDVSSMYRKPSFNITGDNQLNNSSDDLKDDVGVDEISHVEEIVGGENSVEGGREEQGDDILPSTFYSIAEFLKTCQIPGIEIIAGLRANSFMLCHGQFTYRVKNRRRNTLYLICRLDNCSSTALIQLKDKVGDFKKGPKDHNHPPDTDYINLTAFRADLRFECKKNPDTPGKQIFNSVVERHEGVNVKYREVESIIQRCKHAIRAKLSYGRIAEEALADDSEHLKFDEGDLNGGELSESTLMDGDDVEMSDPLKDKSRGNISDDGDIDYDPESSLKHVDVKKLSVAGVEYLNGFRCDSQVITYNNYAYTISMQRHKCIYLRCRIKKCRGTACIARDENNEFCIKVAQDHQHGSEEHYINTLKFRQDLRKESSKHTNLSSREIFDKVSSYHKSRRGNLTYSSIETLLTRTRKRVGDQPMVGNLMDLGSALRSSEWSSAGESYHIPKAHPWFRGVFSAPDGTKIAAFLNDCICRNIQNLEPIILHLDVSYSIRPEVLKNHYVLTSHIVFYNKVFAFGFFLISRKSSIGYRKCFELIQEHSGLFKPNTVLSDYEPALHAAIRIFWPNCSIIGCYYHFVQSIVKKALVCDKLFLRDAVKRRIVKHYLSMPLIPPDYIASGHVIINKIISDENLEAEFCYLDDFFGQYWMDSIGAETFSVYGISNALNDSIEIFHHKLKHTAGARTSVWTFIDALRSLSHNEEADFLEGVESIDKVTGKMVIHKKQEKDMLKAQKELVRNLEGSSKKKFCDPDSAVDSAIASFLIKMSGILDGLLDREAQEPKQGRLIRPRRKLVSTVTNQNELMKVLNHMADHLYEVQDEDGNVISFVKPEPPCSDDEEDSALLDHDYVIEVVCEEAE